MPGFEGRKLGHSVCLIVCSMIRRMPAQMPSNMRTPPAVRSALPLSYRVTTTILVIVLGVSLAVIAGAWLQERSNRDRRRVTQAREISEKAAPAPGLRQVHTGAKPTAKNSESRRLNEVEERLPVADDDRSAVPAVHGQQVDGEREAFLKKTQGLMSSRYREQVLEVIRRRYPQGLRPIAKPDQAGGREGNKPWQWLSNGRVDVWRVQRDGGGYSDLWKEDGWRYHASFDEKGMPEAISLDPEAGDRPQKGTLFFNKNGVEHAIVWMDMQNDTPRLLAEFVATSGGVKYRYYEANRVVDYDQDLKPVNIYRPVGDGVRYQRLDAEGKPIDLWESTGPARLERVGTI